MKLNVFTAAFLFSFATLSQAKDLPLPYEESFEAAVNNPHVLLYFADKFFRSGDYNQSLKYMLNAAEFRLPAAIENSKFMIANNLGTQSNQKEVIAFLEFISQDSHEQKGDSFARLYLADFYRGDRCVWNSDKVTGQCQTVELKGPGAATDLKRSYFFYDGAANFNDRALYHAAMMDILGLGAPRNVPFGVSRLEKLAEKGNASVAFLLGEIHQHGYWVPQNRKEATKWYKLSAEKFHPAATIAYAQSVLSGETGLDAQARAELAISLLTKVHEGVSANDSERTEAHYRLAVVYYAHPHLKANKLAFQHMEFAAKLGNATPSEHSVMANHWLAKQYEANDLRRAIRFNDSGISQLEKMSHASQQKLAAIYQSQAQLYSRGNQRSEAKFSQYMNKYHQVMSKPALTKGEQDSLFGFSAFVFPG